MKTRWTDNVNIDMPLHEYPRPQLKRYLWTNLNGQYDCTVNEDFEKIPQNYDMKITVPFAVETPLSGVERKLFPGEILWYRRYFELDDEYENKRVILHFGAVDWECKVYINGKMVGGHTGGYIPFSFEITDYLKQGENELVVGVFDPTDKMYQQRGKQSLEPHSIWYTATSGIWQTVWIEGINDYYIRSVKITPDIDEFCIHTDVDTNVDFTDYKIFATIYDEEEKEIYSGYVNDIDVITMKSFKLWTPEKPNLYNIMFELFVGDVLYDTVVSYFGMRKFSVGLDDNSIPRLMLNNKVYFQTGVLDQGYWPDGGMTAPTDEALAFDIRVMKSLGFNMIRKHVKVEPLRWYYHCDRLGMIVWQDMVSGGEVKNHTLEVVLAHISDTFSRGEDRENADRSFDDSRQMYRDELNQMINTLYNSVCVGCWVLFNEGWGQFDANRIAQHVKELDMSRVVDHASGWFDMGGGDLKSIHRYVLKVRLPDMKNENRPIVLSEFGGYKRKVENHVLYPGKGFGYKHFKNKKTLTSGYEKLIEKQIVPLVSKGLSAIVYTQLSDVESELNGIMSYDREIIKIDGKVIQKLNKRLVSIIIR